MSEDEFWDHPHEPDFPGRQPQFHFGWRFVATVVGGGLASWTIVGVVAWALWRVARGVGL
jgi:hypothetical protein